MKLFRVAIPLAVAVLFLLGLGLTDMGQADDAKKDEKVFEYAGHKACKMCHKGEKNGNIWETWEASAHAKSFERLEGKDQTNPACLKCHTTGYGKPGGYDPKAETAADLAGVGCEACHGPGSVYKKLSIMKDKEASLANGLIEPDADSCKPCHAGEVPEGHKALPKFDYATMKPKIEHHIPEKG